MKNLHLLVIGSSSEEIRKNGHQAIQDALHDLAIYGDRANALASDEFEFDFCAESTMADLFDRSLAEHLKNNKLELKRVQVMIEFEIGRIPDEEMVRVERIGMIRADECPLGYAAWFNEKYIGRRKI